MEVNQNLIKLIYILNSDIEKANEFSTKKTKKELYDYCISLIPGYSEEEFTEFMKNLSMCSKDMGDLSKISEKDFENVSGGSSGTSDVFSTIVNALYAYQEGKQQGIEILQTLDELNFSR